MMTDIKSVYAIIPLFVTNNDAVQIIVKNVLRIARSKRDLLYSLHFNYYNFRDVIYSWYFFSISQSSCKQHNFRLIGRII